MLIRRAKALRRFSVAGRGRNPIEFDGGCDSSRLVAVLRHEGPAGSYHTLGGRKSKYTSTYDPHRTFETRCLRIAPEGLTKAGLYEPVLPAVAPRSGRKIRLVVSFDHCPVGQTLRKL
jgi:hypothetical protein